LIAGRRGAKGGRHVGRRWREREREREREKRFSIRSLFGAAVIVAAFLPILTGCSDDTPNEEECKITFEPGDIPGKGGIIGVEQEVKFTATVRIRVETAVVEGYTPLSLTKNKTLLVKARYPIPGGEGNLMEERIAYASADSFTLKSDIDENTPEPGDECHIWYVMATIDSSDFLTIPPEDNPPRLTQKFGNCRRAGISFSVSYNGKATYGEDDLIQPEGIQAVAQDESDSDPEADDARALAEAQAAGVTIEMGAQGSVDNSATLWVLAPNVLTVSDPGLTESNEEDFPGLIIPVSPPNVPLDTESPHLRRVSITGGLEWSDLPAGTAKLALDGGGCEVYVDIGGALVPLAEYSFTYGGGAAIQTAELGRALVAEVNSGNVPKEVLDVVYYINSGLPVPKSAIDELFKKNKKGELPPIGWIIRFLMANQERAGGIRGVFDDNDIWGILEDLGAQGAPGNGVALGVLRQQLQQLLDSGALGQYQGMLGDPVIASPTPLPGIPPFLSLYLKGAKSAEGSISITFTGGAVENGTDKLAVTTMKADLVVEGLDESKEDEFPGLTLFVMPPPEDKKTTAKLTLKVEPARLLQGGSLGNGRMRTMTILGGVKFMDDAGNPSPVMWLEKAGEDFTPPPSLRIEGIEPSETPINLGFSITKAGVPENGWPADFTGDAVQATVIGIEVVNPVRATLTHGLIQLPALPSSNFYGNEFSFDDSQEGTLMMPGRVQILPDSERIRALFADRVRFIVESIGDSDLTWYPDKGGIAEYDPDVGCWQALAVFHGMPENNNAFGKKAVTTIVGYEILHRVIEVFFDHDATNHPSGQAGSPNWFNYWSQTSAGFGNPLYYGGEVKMDGFASRYNGVWTPFICKGAGYRGVVPDGPIKNDVVEGIDNFALTCRHEQRHVDLFNQWWPHRDDIPVDGDNDLLPDYLEETLGPGGPFVAGTWDTDHDGYRDGEDYVYFTQATWKVESAIRQNWSNEGIQYGFDWKEPIE